MIMDKAEQQQAAAHHHHGHLIVDGFAPPAGEEEQPAAGEMVDYMLGHNNNPNNQEQQQPTTMSLSLDEEKLMSFSDVLQFADFGPKLALMNHHRHQAAAAAGSDEQEEDDYDDDDDSYLFRFQSSLPAAVSQHHVADHEVEVQEQQQQQQEETTDLISESTTLVVQDQKGCGGDQKQNLQGNNSKNENKSGSGRRKRPRTVKTSEEVESQRMTHIAVERNRRRQMNEYLRILRSLMPGSYVQRGDQASIIGGAIEFIRELEQLIQCLESQKRRRLYGGSGDTPRPPVVDAPGATPSIQQQPQPLPFFPPPSLPPFPTASGDGKILDLDAGGDGISRGEEVAENKSCLADIEVRALGADAMIKILSRRRPGQLIKTIAALEEMQMSILHTNITTIEQTVLYSFNVKIAGDARFSAEDIAGAVHQILRFIDINYTI